MCTYLKILMEYYCLLNFWKNTCGDKSHSDFSYGDMAYKSEEKRKRVVQFLNMVMTTRADLEEVHCRSFHGGGRSQVYCL